MAFDILFFRSLTKLVFDRRTIRYKYTGITYNQILAKRGQRLFRGCREIRKKEKPEDELNTKRRSPNADAGFMNESVDFINIPPIPILIRDFSEMSKMHLCIDTVKYFVQNVFLFKMNFFYI